MSESHNNKENIRKVLEQGPFLVQIEMSENDGDLQYNNANQNGSNLSASLLGKARLVGRKAFYRMRGFLRKSVESIIKHRNKEQSEVIDRSGRPRIHVNGKGSRKKNILFLGPLGFREGVWDTRVKYIFPDLFEPLLDDANLFMLTGPVPEFAKQGIRELKSNYGIQFGTVPKYRKGRSQSEHWIHHASSYAKKINADIVTNIFSPILFSYVAVNIAKTQQLRSVVRVAGDEVSTRLSLGVYEEGSAEHNEDLKKELFGFNYADIVLTMSVLEQRRVRDLCLDESKVKVALRGVDLNRFNSAGRPSSRQVERILFVGRKSLEKGYDVLEDAAKLVEKREPKVEFVFAGTFDKKKEGNRNYVGFVDSDMLPELYGSVDALVLCSRSEGFPQVVMEAMASGLPCILSRHLFEEVFTDMSDAILTDLDPKCLADIIVMLHEDVGLANKLSINAREYAKKNFDNRMWGEIYRELLIHGHDVKADRV